MKTHLPVPERTLPPESARRIRSTITADRLDDDDRRTAPTWLVPLAAALVVIALMATAVVLWPNAARTEVAATPSAVVTPSAIEPTSSRRTDVFRTDRGPLPSEEEATALRYCAKQAGSTDPGVKSLYARRVSDGQQDYAAVMVRTSEGSEWFCLLGRTSGPLPSRDPAKGGPTAKNSVVTDGGVHYGGDGEIGFSSEFLYLTRPGVVRIRARAWVDGKPQRWFEVEVHGELAYLTMYNTGRLDARRRGVSFEHRAFDAAGREILFRGR